MMLPESRIISYFYISVDFALVHNLAILVSSDTEILPPPNLNTCASRI